MNIFFNFKRFRLLVKKDLAIHSKIILISLCTVTGILLLWNLIDPANIYSVSAHPTGLIWLLFIGGVFLTSNAFKEFQNNQKSIAYLLLPASSFEKYVGRLFLTSIGYALAALLFYTVFYWLIAFAALLFTGHQPPLFNPLQLPLWGSVFAYMAVQSLFFLGAVYFKRHVIMKTLLSLTLFGIILSIFSLILGRWVLLNFFTHDAFHDTLHGALHGSAVTVHTGLWPAVWSWHTAIGLIFWVAVTLICWVIGFVRFKEIEVL